MPLCLEAGDVMAMEDGPQCVVTGQDRAVLIGGQVPWVAAFTASYASSFSQREECASVHHNLTVGVDVERAKRDARIWT